MPANFSFTCSKCGNIHEGSPAFSFDRPFYHDRIPETGQWKKTKMLIEEFCVVPINNVQFYFILTCFEIPIIGFQDPLTWAIWANVPGKFFKRYVDTYNQNTNDIYHGEIANEIPCYSDVLAMKISIHRRDAGLRPYAKPEYSDHPIALDYYRGISIKRAQEMIEYMMHRNDQQNIELQKEQ